jgi:acyl-CoA reductase-like NAD-dependent aldehyde dehydrogenase
MEAQAESRDQGKPYTIARAVDIPRSVQNFRYFAGLILHQEGRYSVHESGIAVSHTERMPHGKNA